jgi:hypothetical protein
MSVPLWKRTSTAATGRVADVVLIAFHTGPISADEPMSAARFGLPGRDLVELLDVREHAGPPAVEWMDGFRRGALRTIAGKDLGDLAALDAADACVTVRATVADPLDLGYLQAAWAVARWLFARGASVVLDGRATRFWPARDVSALPPDAAFDVRREVTMVVETQASPGLGGHVVHTRGLVKLARPDLVTVVAAEDTRRAAEALWRLTARLADGYMPAAGDVADADTMVPLHLAPAPEGSFAEALNLDNQAWLVTAADGGAPVWPRDPPPAPEG